MDEPKDRKSKRDREIEKSFREATRSRTKSTTSSDREKELIAIFERILRGTEEEFRRALIDELGLQEGSPEFEAALRFRDDLEF
jgi:hypothetical protein